MKSKDQDQDQDKGKNKKPKLTAIQGRMVKKSAAIALQPPEQIVYQHTVLCQTALPYRNPGDDVRVWERNQGSVMLSIEAGRAIDTDLGRFINLGLPFGPKVRLVLHYLNTEALRIGSPAIEVRDSMTAFIKHLQQRPPTGPEIRKFKDQLARLAAATVRLAIDLDDRTLQVNSQIVRAFDLWLSKDDRQRVLWPSVIQLSDDYFNSLIRHAVPLDERAVAALSHSAMALDVYAWLAQRLHRVSPAGQFIPWAALHQQFGQGYKDIRFFRRVFLRTIDMVKLAYPAARFTTDKTGLMLGNSPPPVKKRMVLVDKPCG